VSILPQTTTRYGSLDAISISKLKRAPCIFAYETGHQLPPKLGYIKEIVLRQEQVRIEYQLHPVEPFLTADDFERMTFELDIGKLELYRTHWAVSAAIGRQDRTGIGAKAWAECLFL
jgi:hypothetical protein